MRVRVVGLSRRERPDPEEAREGRVTEPWPGRATQRQVCAEVKSLSGVHSAIRCRNHFFISFAQQ